MGAGGDGFERQPDRLAEAMDHPARRQWHQRHFVSERNVGGRDTGERRQRFPGVDIAQRDTHLVAGFQLQHCRAQVSHGSLLESKPSTLHADCQQSAKRIMGGRKHW